jgi:hypothetical protein
VERAQSLTRCNLTCAQRRYRPPKVTSRGFREQHASNVSLPRRQVPEPVKASQESAQHAARIPGEEEHVARVPAVRSQPRDPRKPARGRRELLVGNGRETIPEGDAGHGGGQGVQGPNAVPDVQRLVNPHLVGRNPKGTPGLWAGRGD